MEDFQKFALGTFHAFYPREKFSTEHIKQEGLFKALTDDNNDSITQEQWKKLTQFNDGKTFLSSKGAANILWGRLSDWSTSTITLKSWLSNIGKLSDDLDANEFISRENIISLIHDTMVQSFRAYNGSGKGQSESVYHSTLKTEFDKNECCVKNKYKTKSKYKLPNYVKVANKISLSGGGSLEPDLVIMHPLEYPILIIELKAKTKLTKTHTSQLQKYSHHRPRPSILINFNSSAIEIHVKVFNVNFEIVLDQKYNASTMGMLQSKLPTITELAKFFNDKRLAEPENVLKSTYINPFLVSKDKYDKLKSEYDKLQIEFKNLSKMKTENVNLTEAIKQISRKYDNLTGRVNELEKEKQSLSEKWTKEKGDLMQRNREYKTLQSKLTEETKALNELKAKRSGDLAKITVLNEQIEKQKESLKQKESVSASKQETIDKTQNELKEKMNEIVSLKLASQKQLDEMKTQRSAEIKQLIQIKNAFKNENKLLTENLQKSVNAEQNIKSQMESNVNALTEQLQKEKKENKALIEATVKSKDLQIEKLQMIIAKLKKQAVIQEIQSNEECKILKNKLKKRKKKKKRKKRRLEEVHDEKEKDGKSPKRRRLNEEDQSSVQLHNVNETNPMWERKVIGTFQIKSKEEIKSIDQLEFAINQDLVNLMYLPHSKSTVPLKLAKKFIQELVYNTEKSDSSIDCTFLSSTCENDSFTAEFEICMKRLISTKTSFCGYECDFWSLLYTMALFGGSTELHKHIMQFIKIKRKFNKKHGCDPNTLAGFLDFAKRCKYKVTAKNNNESYNHGLNICLHDYQLQSLQWMIDEENDLIGFYRHFYKKGYFADRSEFLYSATFDNLIVDKSLPVAHGGLLCEEMGLGKTIISLALINCNKPQNMNDYSTKSELEIEFTETVEMCRWDYSDPDNAKEIEYEEEFTWYKSLSTLVITSLDLINHWEKECIERSSGKIDYIRYYGQRSRDIKQYIDKDIVFTTYGILSAEDGYDRSKHVLHQIYWHRIILDESQFISNVNNKYSQAINNLRGVNKWCLTSNPFQNNWGGFINQLEFVGLLVGQIDLDERIVLKMAKSMVMRHKKSQKFNDKMIIGSLPTDNQEEKDESTASEC